MTMDTAMAIWELGALAAGGLATAFLAGSRDQEATLETARATAEALDKLRPAFPEPDTGGRAKTRSRAVGNSNSESTQDTMLTLIYQESLALHSDTYFMRLANRPAQILINANYDRVLLLDLATRSAKTLPFPPGVEDFAIYSWLVAPDGSASYLTSSEPVDFGLRLDHNQGTATRFHFPYESSRLMGPCWQTPPPLQILDSNGQVRTLDSTRGIVYASADVLQQEPAKSYLTLRPQWPPHKGAYRGQGVYVSGRQQTLIGYLPPPLSRQPALLAPQEDASAIDVTHHMDNLFVCYEERVEQHVGETMRTVLEAPPDRYLMGVDVVLVGDQPILCVLCATQDQSAQPSGFIELYRLAPEQQQTTG